LMGTGLAPGTVPDTTHLPIRATPSHADTHQLGPCASPPRQEISRSDNPNSTRAGSAPQATVGLGDHPPSWAGRVHTPDFHSS
jgi:hypothetical protein